MRLLNFFLFLFFFQTLSSQVLPCTSDGLNAGGDEPPECVICSIAGVYSGSNLGYSPDTTGYSVPFFVENSVWLSGIIGTTGEISATVLIDSCQIEEGLDFALFGENLNLITFDSSQIVGSPSASLQANGLLTGGLYYFMLDGRNGDVCDFTIIVTGLNEGTFPESAGQINKAVYQK